MKRELFIIEDPETGDLLLDLTEELCEELGWTVGDTLQWEDNGNGSWSVRKIHNDLDEEKEDHS